MEKIPFIFNERKIKELLEILREEQRKDGSFKSYTSLSKNNFKVEQETKTTFTSSLVLFSLNKSRLESETSSVKKKCLKFLFKQKHHNGSWNYFSDNSNYANDIDDTALANLAIHSADKKLLSPKDFEKFVYLLTSCEVNEGGPYTTWLSSKYSIEVDLPVNINILRFLEKIDIQLPSIKRLIDLKVKSNNYSSLYYISPLFTCYFLSSISCLTKNQKQKIIKFVLSQKRNGLWKNTLETGLALNTLINLKADYRLIINSLNLFEKNLNTLKINNEAICLDPAKNEKQMYGGSKAVIISLILELSKFRHMYILQQFYNLMNELNLNVKGLTHCFMPEFTEHTFSFHSSLKSKVLSEQNILKLTLAYLCGILAYDIFDDIYDDKKHTEYVPSALTLLSYMFKSVDELGFSRKIIHSFVIDTNYGITEEKTENKKDKLYPGRKSIGYALPCFLLLSLTHDRNLNQEKHFYKFFLHYLTARALHDDMVDLKKDKSNKHPNSIIDFISRNKPVTERFINQKIKSHINQAKKYLAKSPKILNKNYYYNLLKTLA